MSSYFESSYTPDCEPGDEDSPARQDRRLPRTSRGHPRPRPRGRGDRRPHLHPPAPLPGRARGDVARVGPELGRVEGADVAPPRQDAFTERALRGARALERGDDEPPLPSRGGGPHPAGAGSARPAGPPGPGPRRPPAPPGGSLRAPRGAGRA